MGRTSLCPLHCGHSGLLYTFTVERYISYEKKGEYGDEIQKEILVLESDPLISLPFKGVLTSLNLGDKVLYSYEHRYVKRVEESGGESSYPERIITQLEKQ